MRSNMKSLAYAAMTAAMQRRWKRMEPLTRLALILRSMTS